MNSYDAIRPGRVLANGVELSGTVFQPPFPSFSTILDKTRIVNHTSSTFYVFIGIIRQGQTVKNDENLVYRSQVLGPHTTKIVEELKGVCLDFPSELYGAVQDASGIGLKFDKVSITITGTQKRN